ncbi:MAG: ring,2-phenylacetyl-CoA epoxidase subunit PaaE [Bacteroidota bacterium]|nr:ring,2-phenylacetyl-CoA epoxidase subunit PaaE [Bacteroidota bacterium]
MAERIVKIRIYGEDFKVSVGEDDTILTAAMEQNLDPPYSCQLGACATCKALLLNGRVEMDERDALTDSEIEEGYILTCQSHPLTDDVSIDYDI